MKIVTSSEKGSETIEGDVLLVAIGVAPLLPEGLEFKRDVRGYIQTDDKYQTNVPDIYAAGDIIGPPWLAHVASWEAVQAVEGLYKDHQPKKVSVFPGCTYCQPQVASVGLTERAAKEAGKTFKVGRFPFQASGKAQAVGETEGFVKLIIAEPHGEILGAHIIGPEATELIAELGLAINLEATHEDIEATIHAHPTLSESVPRSDRGGFQPSDSYLDGRRQVEVSGGGRAAMPALLFCTHAMLASACSPGRGDRNPTAYLHNRFHCH